MAVIVFPELAAPALWALGTLVGTLGYAALVPTRRVQFNRYGVELRDLPPALDGLRLLQISDLHIGPLFGPGSVRRLVARGNACRPDLVALTGDFVDFRSLRYLPAALEELRGLQARLGVYACLGNHDHWEDAAQVRRLLEALDVQVLVNENLQVADGLWLAAVDDLMSGAPDWERTLAGLPDDQAVVLLCHNPIGLPEVAGPPWLVLAGHTHGGQISLPLLGPRGTARVPGIRSFMRHYEGLGARAHGGRPETVSTYRYPAGWYCEGETRMYVNRGAGFSHGWPLRLNCPPEIACFALRPSALRW